MVSSIALFTAKNKMEVLYLPRQAFQKDEPHLVILGTASNNPIGARPKFVTLDAVKNVIICVDKDKVPDGIATGIDIDKDDAQLNKFFVDDDGNLKDTKTKVAARFPVSHPIAWQALLKTGTMQQASFDSLDRADESGLLAFWAEQINNHDPELQQLLCGEADLKKYLPPSPPTGHSYISSPFVQMHDPNSSDEDLEVEVLSLVAKCTEIAQRNMAKAISLSDDASSKGAPSAVLVAASPKKGSSDADAALTNSKPAAFDEKDHFNARLLALGAFYDPTSGKLAFPILSDFIPEVRDISGKGSQRDAAEATLASIEEMMGDSKHFLLRSVDMPKFEKLALAYISQGKLSRDMIDSLDITNVRGMIVSMLFPDSGATAKSKAEHEGQTENEEAVGEHASNRTKISTSYTAVSELTTVNFVVSTLANIVGVGLNLFYFKFELEATNGSPIPGMAYYASKFAEMLTSRPAKMWLRTHENNTKLQFQYFVLNQIVSIMTCLAKASGDVMVTTNILRKDFDSVPVSHYKLANDIFVDTKSQVDRIFMNSMSPPTTSLWEKSQAKQRFDEKKRKRLVAELNADTPRGDAKRDRRASEQLKNQPGGGKAKSGKDKKGYISCKSANFSLPKELHNKDFKLCKSFARDEHVCPLGERCSFLHKYFNELSKPQQKALVSAVDTADDLSFVNVDESLLKSIREE